MRAQASQAAQGDRSVGPERPRPTPATPTHTDIRTVPSYEQLPLLAMVTPAHVTHPLAPSVALRPRVKFVVYRHLEAVEAAALAVLRGKIERPQLPFQHACDLTNPSRMNAVVSILAFTPPAATQQLFDRRTPASSSASRSAHSASVSSLSHPPLGRIHACGCLELEMSSTRVSSPGVFAATRSATTHASSRAPPAS